ncbi:MAG: HPr(Ser) kinase/phosphatase [Salinisphaeraceae bacterium]|nr:HPr(Ser) kinase/phosphatase [Salinisphaeraceae bacterium]
MSGELTVRDLQTLLADSCQLRWANPNQQTGADNHLRGSALGAMPVPMAGYLNLIHPPQVQVIGSAELSFLEQGSDSELNLLGELATSDTAVVIMADNLQLPEPMQQTLQQADIALLATELPGHKLLYRLRHFLGEALAPQKTMHGVMLEILGIGVLITGISGIGKSELALELINRGHRLGADDAPEIFRTAPDTVSGRSPALLRNFLSVRGLGILDIRAMFGQSAVRQQKKLELIVHLQPAHESNLPAGDRLAGSRSQLEILEVIIPQITLPVVAGHNLAVLVEAACRDHMLRAQGYAADQAFAQRQAAMMVEDDQENQA